MREAQNHGTMSQGSTGNVIAALASFFIPGLGQLLATIDAAVWKPRA